MHESNQFQFLNEIRLENIEQILMVYHYNWKSYPSIYFDDFKLNAYFDEMNKFEA